ncbi:sortase-dependent protein [Streptomyces sp. NPDC001928]|uniref:sortase-dependent protein n=1 Tax=Streptomyces sp. NPDC001928 TaxID=3154404 RepID=UPI00331DD520
MRRTTLSALVLTCAAVLAAGTPAFADSASPVPSDEPTRVSSPAPSEPSAEPTRAPSPVPSEASPEPTRAPGGGQVSVRPSGAPDTGVTPTSGTGTDQGALIGGGAAALLVAGGAATFVVRRRRANGA